MEGGLYHSEGGLYHSEGGSISEAVPCYQIISSYSESDRVLENNYIMQLVCIHIIIVYISSVLK